MTFSEKFRFRWWLATLALLSVSLLARGCQIYLMEGEKQPTTLDAVLLLFWSVLVLVPIFSEISFAGLTVKRQIDEAKKEILGAVTTVATTVSQGVNINFLGARDFQSAAAVQTLDAATKIALKQYDPETPGSEAPDSEPIEIAGVDAKSFNLDPYGPDAIAVTVGVVKRKLEKAIRELAARHRVPLADGNFNRHINALALHAIMPSELITPVRVLHSVCVDLLAGKAMTDSQIGFVRDNQKELIEAIRKL